MLSLTPAPADAAKKLTITVISGNTHHYAPIGAVIKAFMPKVDEILAKTGNYKVSWIKGFGGQVVKVRGELEAGRVGRGRRRAAWARAEPARRGTPRERRAAVKAAAKGLGSDAERYLTRALIRPAEDRRRAVEVHSEVH